MKRLCVSACLLGVPCRWKGDAKPCEAVQRLADDPDVELVPFCPELAAGLGCPRPPIELVLPPSAASESPKVGKSESPDLRPSDLRPSDSGARIRALRVDRQGDATDAIRAACEAEADELVRTGGVDGFILKSRSPSCGLSSPLHDPSGREIGTAPGLWAALARERFPAADFRDETELSPPPVSLLPL